MADAPASFSDYIRQAQGGGRKTSTLDPSKFTVKGSTPDQPNAKPDPLTWLIDIISRPLYGTTEVADTSIEAVADAELANEKFQSGDVLGGIGQLASNAVKGITAPIRGWTSTDPEDKHTTSDLIEKGTDTYGPRFNENYVDEQDNVNPVLKGVLGFAGDVAGDPLTYLPGAAFLSVGRGVGKLAKGAGNVAVGAAGGAKAAITARKPTEAVAEALQKGEKTPVAAENAPVEALNDVPAPTAAREVVDAVEEAKLADETVEVAKPYKVHTPEGVKEFATKAEQTAFTRSLRDQGFTSSRAAKLKDRKYRTEVVHPTPAKAVSEAVSLGDTMRAAPKFEQLKNVVNALVKEAPPAVAAAAKKPKLLSRADWMRQTARLADEGDEDAAIKVLHPNGKREYVSHNSAVARKTEPAVAKALGAAYDDYAKAIGGGKNVDVLGRDIEETLSPVEAVTNSVERLGQIARDNETAFDMAFGPSLAAQLKKVEDPEHLDQYLGEMADVVNSTGLLDDLKLVDKSPVVKMFQHLGIEDPFGVQRLFAEKDAILDIPVSKESVVDKAREVGKQFDNNPDDPVIRAQHDAMEVLTGEDGFLNRQFIDPGNYPFITKTGVLRDSKKFGKGKGIRLGVVRTHAQYDLAVRLHKRVVERVSKYTDKWGKPIAGQTRAATIEKEWLEALEASEVFLQKHGQPIHIDLEDGSTVALSLSEIYKMLGESPVGKEVMRMAFHNQPTAMAPTIIMEAVAMAVKGSPIADIEARLVSAAKRNGKVDGEPIPHFLAGADEAYDDASKVTRAVYGYAPNPKGERNAFGGLHVRNPKANKKGYFVYYENTTALRMMLEAIDTARFKLVARAEENAARYINDFSVESKEMAEQAIDEIARLANDPVAVGKALGLVADTGTVVKELGKTRFARNDSVAAANDVVAKAMPVEVKATAENLSTATGHLEAGDNAAAAATHQSHFTKTMDESDALNDEVDALVREAGDDTYDISAKWYSSIKTGITKVIDPLARVFNAKTGMNDKLKLYNLHHGTGIMARTLLGRKVNGLREMNAKYGDFIPGTTTPRILQAFHDLQAGVRSSDPQTAAAYDELLKYMGDMFDMTGEAPILGNVFFRSAVGVQYINDTFAAYKVLGSSPKLLDGKAVGEQLFDIAKAEKDAAAQGIDTLSAAAGQWRTWDVQDPVDFISKLNAASIQMATDVSVAESFVQMAKNADLASSVPKPGYARIIAEEGKSKYANLIHNFGGDSLYYDKELLNGLHRMDEVAKTSKGLDGTLGEWIHKYYDPTLNAWKYAITLPRPGHHTRNLMGDESMTYLAEGVKHQKRSMTDAFKVMSLRNDYADVDIVRALTNLGEKTLPTKGTVISSGKYGDITADGVYEAMMRHGILPPANVVEDLYDADSISTGLKTVLDKVTLRGGKIEKAVSGVSEYRDHYTRTKHFIQFIHKAQEAGDYKSLDEMLEAGAEKVLKWHPDVSLRSLTEQKYFRRIIPFYSWMAGAVPVIAEALVINPGRVNSFNKASYNLAVSMGLNPESLSDPFPEDQLFPSFLTEQMQGPQFQVGDDYFSINPGFAPWDVLNTLGPDPVRGIAGSVAPMLRVPVEMLAGGSFGTGARINDQSDYLDSSIPGVNYISNITGNSVTGSLASMLAGQGFDPQFQHAAGNKGPADQALSAVNWLTGLGIANQSKPNYINYAEIEKRNAEGEKRGF